MANFVNVGTLSERSKFGKMMNVYIFLKLKIAKFLHVLFVPLVKCLKFGYLYGKLNLVTPQFSSVPTCQTQGPVLVFKKSSFW